MKLIGRFPLSALAILNFTKAGEETPEHHEDVFYMARRAEGGRISSLHYAPNTDGTTHGPSADGWSWQCLVMRDDIALWKQAGETCGDDVEDAGCPEAGHYGDGSWAGVDLAQCPSDESAAYWINLEL